MKENSALPKLAVVPFRFHGESKSHLDIIGEILANNLITRLSRSLHLTVISRLSTTKFRNTRWSPALIKSKLACDFVLSGTYINDNSQLRVVFRLTNISKEVDIWADEINCSVRDILATDSDLVKHLAANTAKRIFESSVSQPKSDSLGNLETHALYIQGLNFMHSESTVEFKLALENFKQIVERQPMHSTVHALISLWHLLQTQRNGGWALRGLDGSAATMRYSIEKSLELNPGNEYALALKGAIEVYLDKNIDLGLDLTRQALVSSKNDPGIFCYSSMVTMAARRYEEAATDIEKAIELSPLDPQLEYFYALAAAAHYHTGRYLLAEQYARRSIDINPNHTSPFRTIIATQMATNEPALARVNAQKLLNIEPGFTVESWLRYWSGNRDDGERFAAYLSAAGIPKR